MIKVEGLTKRYARHVAVDNISFEVKPGQTPSGRTVMKRGLMIVGQVTDQAGGPIQGALVRAKFLNDIDIG